ncbi:MAG: TonB-dependent receptor [Prevotella sp.]|nr:TonB-dependent receptor [Prevotella sp.]
MKKTLSLGLALVWPVLLAGAFGQTRGGGQTRDAVPTLSDSLQEVVVTGTGTQHLLKDAPVQTEVITAKMLKNYGGRSIEDILSGLTSSFAFNEDDMGSQMQLNGLGNDYILILIDGKRIHGDVGGQNDLSLIDPQNIEKIEIVKGAASALYGSDAIAGVINIITKKHNEGLLIENSTRGGSYGDLRQHNGLGLAIGRVKSYTNFHLQHSDGWQNTATEDPHQTERLIEDSRNMTVNRYTNWQVSERLTYEPFKGLELYADGSTYWKRIYRPSGKYAAVDVKTYDLEYRNQSLAAGAKWNHGLTREKTDAITLDVNWDRHAYYYYYTAITLTDGYDPKGNFTPYYPYFPDDEELQSDQRRTMAHLKGIFSLPGNHRLSGGLEWRYDYLKAPMRVADGKATDHTEALYLQDEWRCPLNATTAVSLTPGLRLNHNGQFGYRFTPKVSAMLTLGENIRLRATWSQGFKTPTPKEQHYRYVRYMNATYLYLGNEYLKPQTSNYYALSGEWNWQGLNVTVTGYLNKLDNMIALVTIPNTQAPAEYIVKYDPVKTRQYQNMEEAETKGIDLSLRYRLGREWMFGGSYSYLDTDAKKYDTTHERLVDVVIDGTAHHKGSWFATWNHAFSPKYTMGVGLYGRMSSTRYYQINGNGKGYQTWRLSTSHEFPVARKWLFGLEAGIDNIFNYCDRTYHGLHLGTTTPGRTVYGKLTVRFAQGKKLKITNNMSNSKSNNNEED